VLQDYAELCGFAQAIKKACLRMPFDRELNALRNRERVIGGFRSSPCIGRRVQYPEGALHHARVTGLEHRVAFLKQKLRRIAR
jgi:hypothetical protein